MAEVSVHRNHIRSSFDLWSGISQAELVNSVGCDGSRPQRQSLQVDPHPSLQLSCPLLLDPCQDEALLQADAAELLMLLQAQQQQQQQQEAVVEDNAPTEEEAGIDAQIQRLLQLKQFLRRNKQSAGQQQQVILEDVALPAEAAEVLEASTLYSSGLVTPPQSESLMTTPDLTHSWGNLATARAAAAQPSRRSIDLGGLAQQLAALELNSQAVNAAAALVDAQGAFSSGMRPSASFTAGMAGLDNRLSIDMMGSGAGDINDNLIAAAAMAAAANAQAEASRRASLCLATPQASGLLDTMLLDSMASTQLAPLGSTHLTAHDALAGGSALALQSALYAPAALTPLDAQLSQAMVGQAAAGGLSPVTLSTSACLAAGMPPPRHSLDCSLLCPDGLAPLGAAAPQAAGLHSPVMMGTMPGHPCGRASLNLPQAPLLADRGYGPAQAQAQAETAGWNFGSRRAGGPGRASHDVRRVSSELVRVQTPDIRQPPRKSVSLISSSCSSTGGSATSSSNSSGRGSPHSRASFSAGPAAARRVSLERPPIQPPKPSLAASVAAKLTAHKVAEAAGGGNTAAPGTGCGSPPSAPSRKGTGVFIPSCMIKS